MPSSLSATCIVAAVLRVPGLSEVQQFQRFHRALDRRTWLARQASRRLLMPLIEAFAPSRALLVAPNDTLKRQRSAKIAARGVHHDRG
ncbi:MAG: hypothetical protein ACJ8G3_20635 [Burkholderiaceae bacterium]